MDSYPFVTVIAPCRNEADFIENVIESILAGNYPGDKIEVLIVDGMSDDGTREIIAAIAEKDSRVRLIDNPKRIVPVGMNLGIKEAKGEYIVRIDCHCYFAADYISKCIEIAQRTGAVNVGGYMETVAGDESESAKAIAVATSSRFGVGNSAFRVGGQECEVDTVPFGTFQKTIFEQIGYYDERLVRNQDIELNSRIRKAGGKIVISPEIHLKYYNRATYQGIWQQSFNNGLWNPYTIWLVGGGLQLRHFVPMFFVLSVIVLSISSMLYWPFAVLLAADLAMYSAAASYFAVRVGRDRKVSMSRLLLAYFVLHIGYGLGSVWAFLTIPFKFPSRTNKAVGKVLADRK